MLYYIYLKIKNYCNIFTQILASAMLKQNMTMATNVALETLVVN